MVRSVLIVGNGNVAIDLARILSKSAEDLKKYDIPDHVISKLKDSKIEKIHIVGRRGVVQSAFTRIEMNELRESADIHLFENEVELSKNESSVEEMKQNKPLKNKFDLLTSDKVTTIKCNDPSSKFNSSMGEKRRPQVYLRYLLAPYRLIINHIADASKQQFQLQGIEFQKTTLKGAAFNQIAEVVDNSKTEMINADLTILSIGYKVGATFKNTFKTDSKTGLVETEFGVLKDLNGQSIKNAYACGWFKRGPKGILNSTIIDSSEVFNSIRSNYQGLKSIKEIGQSLDSDLYRRDDKDNETSIEGTISVNYFALFRKEQANYVLMKEDCMWLLDLEKENGKTKGKVADKFIIKKEIFDLINLKRKEKNI